MTKILIDEATVKLALEALKNTTPTGFNMERDKQFFAAITALREALAQQALDKKAENARELGLDYEPAQQEPVACEWWEHTSPVTGIKDVQDWQLTEADKAAGWIEQPLYTSPPAQRTWVGLSPADRGKCLSAGDAHGWIGVMEATEAKLKEKNT